MKTVSINAYIYLGTNIWYFQSMNTSRRINSSGGVRKNLESLNEKLNEFGLPVSARAAGPLTDYCRTVFTDGEDDVFTQDICNEIKRRANTLRSTIDFESFGVFAHIVTEGRYSSDYLLNDVWKLFGDSTKAKIDDIAIYDIEEAAKCVVFERPTAAAFHLMRATESVLKHFYCHLVKRNRVSLMWGPMVAALKIKRNPPDRALLDHLDGLRRNFRNPTQHPEKLYEMSEVQDLFGVCVDVINRMAAGMPNRPD